MSKRIFVVSDLHLGHDMLATEGHRPAGFSEKLLENLNRILNPSDILIDLGDIAFGKDSALWIERLKFIDCTKWLVRGNHDRRCVSKETRILTRQGYKFWHEIKEGDLIPTADLETGKVEFNPILDIYVYKNEPYLYQAKHRRGEMAVTAHHTVIYQSGNEKIDSNWRKNIAENVWTIKSSFVVPCHFSSSGTHKCDIKLLKLLAWIMTDGSIDEWNTILIYQSKINYVKEIRQLLSSLNIKYSEGVRNRKVEYICGKAIKLTLPQYVFRLSAEESRNILKILSLQNKYHIPEWLYDLSDSDFEVFLDELVKGDGSFRKNGHRVIWGKKGWLLGIMGLCVTHNAPANLLKQTGRNNFYLGIRGSRGHKQFASKHLKKIPYNDLVWCVNVKNHNFFAELNGKTFVTGNSFTWYMEHGYNFVCDSFSLEIFGKKILFSHQPMPINDYDLNIHGHFHKFSVEKIKEVEPHLFALLTPKHRLISMENLKYEPVKLQTVVEEW